MQNPSQFAELYESYLQDHLFKIEPRNLYFPATYALKSGGKRLRPQLVLSGCFLFGGDLQKSLPAAHAVEIFHNFTLVHDDIMDEAPLRRGQPAVHTMFDVNTAILSGDVMLIHAYENLLNASDGNNLSSLLKVFNTVAIEVCEGQQLDVDFEKSNEVTISNYLDMIEKKTAALLGGALHMGALVANAPGEDCRLLELYGRKSGIAFQLQDDLLDVFGDPEKFGKKPGGDIVNGKKTFLYLKALEIASPEVRQKLQELYVGEVIVPDEKVTTVRKIYETLGVRDKTLELQQQFFREALAHLGQISAPAGKKEHLKKWAEEMIHRDI